MNGGTIDIDDRGRLTGLPVDQADRVVSTLSIAVVMLTAACRDLGDMGLASQEWMPVMRRAAYSLTILQGAAEAADLVIKGGD